MPQHAQQHRRPRCALSARGRSLTTEELMMMKIALRDRSRSPKSSAARAALTSHFCVVGLRARLKPERFWFDSRRWDEKGNDTRPAMTTRATDRCEPLRSGSIPAGEALERPGVPRAIGPGEWPTRRSKSDHFLARVSRSPSDEQGPDGLAKTRAMYGLNGSETVGTVRLLAPREHLFSHHFVMRFGLSASADTSRPPRWASFGLVANVGLCTGFLNRATWVRFPPDPRRISERAPAPTLLPTTKVSSETAMQVNVSRSAHQCATLERAGSTPLICSMRRLHLAPQGQAVRRATAHRHESTATQL